MSDWIGLIYDSGYLPSHLETEVFLHASSVPHFPFDIMISPRYVTKSSVQGHDNK